MFKDASYFNGELHHFNSDVSSGKTFVGMFENAAAMNAEDIKEWQMTSAEDLTNMFKGADSFADLSEARLLRKIVTTCWTRILTADKTCWYTHGAKSTLLPLRRFVRLLRPSAVRVQAQVQVRFCPSSSSSGNKGLPLPCWYSVVSVALAVAHFACGVTPSTIANIGANDNMG